jgi:hypothetical protein
MSIIAKNQTVGSAVRVANSAHGIPCYLVTARNETRQVEVVSDREWSGHLEAGAGAHVASEAYRLGFPSRFLVCFEGEWRA